MSRVKINFSNRPIPVQIQKARDIVVRMTGNLSYPSPVPTLAAISQVTDELESAYIAALNGDKEKKALMRTKRKELEGLISKLAPYVQTASAGDQDIILSSGFEVCKTPQPIMIPVTPENLKTGMPTKDGELELTWNASKRAITYLVQFTKDPITQEGFKPVDIVTKSRLLVKHLDPGTKYWFRVLAINTAGKSPWSEPVSGRTMLF